jgi:hypothetical protein
MTTKIFKPLKLLMRKHDCALRFVHHMGKGGADDTRRGGQKMLGGTANHAWAEDSLYIGRGKTGTVHMEFESKSAPEKQYTISGLDNRGWTPYFEPEKPKQEPVPTARGRRAKPSTPKGSPAAANPTLDYIRQGGVHRTKDLASAMGRDYNPTYKSLKSLEGKGLIALTPNGWQAT